MPVLPSVVPVSKLASGAVMLAMTATATVAVNLTVVHAVILGLIEGITEYLPVSSTGHLLVATRLLSLGGTPAADDALDTYAICIQSGAILAVLFLYKERIWQMVDGLLGRDDDGRRIFMSVMAAFIPTAIIAGVIFPVVQDKLFGNNIAPIAAAWLIGGVAILVLARTGFLQRGGHELALLTAKQAGIIGLLQAIAIWPGVSRSLVTIIAGVLVGMNLKSAVEFSFLLGVVTLTAATAYEGVSGGANLVDQFGVVAPLVGLIVAFVSAVIAIRWMVSWLQEKGIAIFGVYRIAIGILTFIGIGLGWF